jgi:hypothetical protein
VEGILSQTHCAAQFNTAQERPPERVAANMDNVQKGAASRLGVIAFCPNEKERTSRPSRAGLLVQHDAQKRSVDLKSAVVLDEAQFPELVHEKTDA